MTPAIIGQIAFLNPKNPILAYPRMVTVWPPFTAVSATFGGFAPAANEGVMK